VAYIVQRARNETTAWREGAHLVMVPLPDSAMGRRERRAMATTQTQRRGPSRADQEEPRRGPAVVTGVLLGIGIGSWALLVEPERRYPTMPG